MRAVKLAVGAACKPEEQQGWGGPQLRSPHVSVVAAAVMDALVQPVALSAAAGSVFGCSAAGEPVAREMVGEGSRGLSAWQLPLSHIGQCGADWLMAHSGSWWHPGHVTWRCCCRSLLSHDPCADEPACHRYEDRLTHGMGCLPSSMGRWALPILRLICGPSHTVLVSG